MDEPIRVCIWAEKKGRHDIGRGVSCMAAWKELGEGNKGEYDKIHILHVWNF